jgi:putative phosphoribosyl transferase
MLRPRALFADRREAGRRLAAQLKREDDVLVLALPRGGVPVGYEIALALEAPLDVVLVRKIGAPHQPEFALGALVEAAEPILVLNPEAPRGFAEHIETERRRQEVELARRRALYRGGRLPTPVSGRNVIVVDDGVATGASLRAALTALKQAGARKRTVAVPVGPAESLEALSTLADEIVCLATPDPFVAVGEFYSDFTQTSDAEVTRLLEDAYARGLG